MLKVWLDSEGLEYEEIDVQEDPSKRNEFIKLGYLTVPILVHDGEGISQEPYSNITAYLDNKLGIKVTKQDGSKTNEETSKISEVGIEKITVYSKPGCGMCVFTKKHLEKSGVDFHEVDVTQDSDGLAHIKSLGYSGLPVVKFGNVHFNGFNPAELDKIIISVKETH